MYVESNSRALLKACTWRITATTATAILVYIFTGSFKLAFAVGGLEFFAKMGLYYLHERGWNKIKFGRKEVEPAVFWLTGYSGAGKKPIAHAMETRLREKGFKVEVLEGDKIRKFFPSIGYTHDEREAHVKRVAFLASELEKHGIVVVVSMTSPFRAGREFAKEVCKKLVEVHVATPAAACEVRDPKGLWKKARAGQLKDFVGVDLPYEEPDAADVTVDLEAIQADEASRRIVSYVYKR